MATYKVTWEIEVEADDAVAAAMEAQRAQLDPTSIGNVFDVQDDTGTSVQVDLQDVIHKQALPEDAKVYVYTQTLDRTLEVRLTDAEYQQFDDARMGIGELLQSGARELVLYRAIQRQYGSAWPWDHCFEGTEELAPKHSCFTCGEAGYDDECEGCSIERQLDGDT